MSRLIAPSFTMLIRRIAVLPVRLYQRCVSPLFPAACRFYPSCSDYALQAILRHGVARGIWLGACRIARCHPWSPGGYDPVPPADSTHFTTLQK